MPVDTYSAAQQNILLPGHNCWRKEKADCVSFLIDAEAYFSSFRSASRKAERSIIIIGWDLDSRIKLEPIEPEDDLPVIFGDFLLALVKSKPALHVYILLWNCTPLFALDREWFLELRIGDEVHERLHLLKDNCCPFGSSHHQKIAIVDDILAFVGGMDLTKNIWDRRAHLPRDPNRFNPEGETYGPNHDIQLLVSGKAAVALGVLARRRWRQAAKTDMAASVALEEKGDIPWPTGIGCDLQNVVVGISRTEPEYENREAVREIEQLYLDSIAAAHRSIYIENQYFTSPRIVAALAAKLKQDNGPEVIIVLPLQTDGWLSQLSMDLLRANAIKNLRAADRYDRLLICYPHHEGLAAKEFIKVHSKLMIVDDKLVRVGSANLNNRSMRLDTECDLTIEVHDDAVSHEVISGLREGLLCEHLGVDRDVFRRVLSPHGSLKMAIQHFCKGPRLLKELQVKISKAEELWLERHDLLDPEFPIQPFRLYRDILPLPDEVPDVKKTVRLSILVLLIVGAALAWHFFSLEQYIEGRGFSELIEWCRGNQYAPVLLMVSYIVGGLVMIPITLLISLTILAWGPLYGAGYALTGSVLNAVVIFWIGSLLGKKPLKKVTGRYIDKANRFLVKRGIASTIVLRLVPVAPFTIINLLAGASQLKFRDYLLGTILGMAPGILALAGLIDSGIALASDPNLISLSIFIGLAAVIGLGIWWLRKWLFKQ